jgi:putative ABC transport system ATP-binding protein
MLELDSVRLVYNRGAATETVALDNLSLTVRAGDFITIVGSNGAGKSSLVGVVSGAVRPTRGRVLINDRDVTALPDYRRSRWIARVFDNPHAGTLPSLSIEDNMALAMNRGRRRGLRWAVTRSRRAVMRDRLAQLNLGLEDRLTDPVALLSAGQRQSVTLMMASLVQPEILLLDEHLSALDPVTQARVLELTVRLVESMRCQTIMVTHNMEHAISLGNRLLVMSRGRIIAEYSDEAKAALTVAALVEDITAKGAVMSDRSMLAQRPGA